MEQLMAILEWARSPEGVKTIETLVPVIVAVVGIIFKLNSDKRNKVAHAVDWAIKLLRVGRMDVHAAASHILATGAVKKKIAVAIIEAVAEKKSLSIKPIKGIAVELGVDGSLSISPDGLVNKANYKLGKWLRKKLQ